MPNIFVSITNNRNMPISAVLVEFYTENSAILAGSSTTDASGKCSVVLSSGTYKVKATEALKVINLGKYIVKSSIPHHFSGLELLNSSVLTGPFEPKRFRNTRYDHSNMSYSIALSQRANWSI